MKPRRLDQINNEQSSFQEKEFKSGPGPKFGTIPERANGNVGHTEPWLSWEVWDWSATFREAGLGSAAAWQAPTAGPLQQMFPRDIPDATPGIPDTTPGGVASGIDEVCLEGIELLVYSSPSSNKTLNPKLRMELDSTQSGMADIPVCTIRCHLGPPSNPHHLTVLGLASSRLRGLALMNTDLWKQTCEIDYFRTISCVRNSDSTRDCSRRIDFASSFRI